MKKKLALGIAALGAALLSVSLTAFGLGAATTLTHASASASAENSLPGSAPTEGPLPLEVSTTTAGSSAESPSAADNADPTESEAFKAMTPEEQANGIEWLKTQQITASCMKDKGYDYTFVALWMRDKGEPAVRWAFVPPWADTLPEPERAAAKLALDGNTGGGADYHWDDAGCYGYAVHVMGNDNAH